MRSSYLLVPLVFAACFEGERAQFGCPPGEDCSPDTPDGLHFFGAGLTGVLDLDNPPTAIGGTQHVLLSEEVGDTFVDLESGYIAYGGAFLSVIDTEGAVVTLHGDAVGSNHLEIRDADDDTLMDRKLFEAAELATVSVTHTDYEGSDLPVAFLPGTIRFGIALATAAGDRLVDDSMTLDLPGATQVTWDSYEVADAAVGALPVTVTAAGKPPITVDVTVVAAVETIVDEFPPTQELEAGATGFVCFEARAAGHFIADLEWSFTTTNGEVDFFLSPSCVTVTPATAGSVTLTATAGGVDKVVTYPVKEASAKPSARPASPRRFTGGERAAGLSLFGARAFGARPSRGQPL